ncbi:B12-binding domain-containing radical SAM protein [Pseudomaricurvus alkylphenolicus]|uniref:B12-binding domain-containing radical SAM protein n=1 Tax=Pseudomaricurvus alkylphenolicus TaxID=1306991 RepID=UPI00141FEF1E|nr:radical SAM protein [Pseudomaricurvus alkylphenolicus]NIB44636.1 B12-binding domain-containing radical SAM protein [Pseudomaricurvus alkylphenolicus]
MEIVYALLHPISEQKDSRFLRPNMPAALLSSYAKKVRPAKDIHTIIDENQISSLTTTEDIANHISSFNPEIVAFSVYVWNHLETKLVCNLIKNKRPSTKIVLGGPEVAFETQNALNNFNADWICTGEGEIAFTDLLGKLDSDPSFNESIDGMLCSRASNHKHYSKSPAPTVDNLDEIPSPFSDSSLKLSKGSWVDLESMRGCPFSCSFCMYGKGYGGMRYYSMDRVNADLNSIKAAGVSDAYFLDPTFNLPKDRCIKICRLINEVNADKSISFHVEARAEIIDEGMADAFSEANIVSVEVGLQSSDSDVLKLMSRSLVRDKFVDGCRLLRERGIRVDIGIIAGLPGDNSEKLFDTIEFVGSRNLGHISVYPLQLLPGSNYQINADKLGIRYNPHPPYLVTSTNELNASELSELTLQANEFAEQYNRKYLSIMDVSISMKHKKKKKKTNENFRKLKASKVLQRSAIGI